MNTNSDDILLLKLIKQGDQIAFRDVVPGSVNLSADISGNTEIVKAKALYARVGVLANGADQAIYSPVVRLK